MDKVSRQRRQLLLYLGLSVLGAGATAACGFSPKRTNPSTTMPIAIADATLTNATLAAAKEIPDFQGIEQWLNSDPLTIADLKGSVVLIQFWTFACINCRGILQKVGGIIVILTALFILLGWDLKIQLWLAPFFPPLPI